MKLFPRQIDPPPYIWTKFFAWYPIKLTFRRHGDSGWRWLCWIEVKITGYVAPNGDLTESWDMRDSMGNNSNEIVVIIGITMIVIILIALATCAKAATFGCKPRCNQYGVSPLWHDNAPTGYHTEVGDIVRWCLNESTECAPAGNVIWHWDGKTWWCAGYPSQCVEKPR